MSFFYFAQEPVFLLSQSQCLLVRTFFLPSQSNLKSPTFKALDVDFVGGKGSL